MPISYSDILKCFPSISLHISDVFISSVATNSNSSTSSSLKHSCWLFACMAADSVITSLPADVFNTSSFFAISVIDFSISLPRITFCTRTVLSSFTSFFFCCHIRSEKLLPSCAHAVLSAISIFLLSS